MKQTIKLTIDFEHDPPLKKQELFSMAVNLADHIFDTFNDDSTMSQYIGVETEEKNDKI